MERYLFCQSNVVEDRSQCLYAKLGRRNRPGEAGVEKDEGSEGCKAVQVGDLDEADRLEVGDGGSSR